MNAGENIRLALNLFTDYAFYRVWPVIYPRYDISSNKPFFCSLLSQAEMNSVQATLK